MLKFKKLFVLFLLPLIALVTYSCTQKQTLFFLNWGEYINDDLVAQFEKEYNCNVVVDIADSNELFYAKLKSGTTCYDLCCPAEYMVEKMYIKGLIQQIDFDKLENWDKYGGFSMFMTGVLDIEASMNQIMLDLGNEGKCNYTQEDFNNNLINTYHMPYYWGTFGLMYNRRCNIGGNYIFASNDEDREPDIFQTYDPWKVYFQDESLKGTSGYLNYGLGANQVKAGAYDAVRFSYAAAMQYKYDNPNIAVSSATLKDYKDIMSKIDYYAWRGDELKHMIEAGNIDIAFAYTGDMVDMLYEEVKNGVEYEDIEFGTYTPSNTTAHIDTLVIPWNSRHTDLAHKFIDYLLDPVNQWYNTRDIGYCPPSKAVYQMITNYDDPTVGIKAWINEDSYAYIEWDEEELHWLENWSKIMKDVFPTDANLVSTKHGTPMSYFESSDINKLNNVINLIKVS